MNSLLPNSMQLQIFTNLFNPRFELRAAHAIFQLSIIQLRIWLVFIWRGGISKTCFVLCSTPSLWDLSCQSGLSGSGEEQVESLQWNRCKNSMATCWLLLTLLLEVLPIKKTHQQVLTQIWKLVAFRLRSCVMSYNIITFPIQRHVKNTENFTAHCKQKDKFHITMQIPP